MDKRCPDCGEFICLTRAECGVDRQWYWWARCSECEFEFMLFAETLDEAEKEWAEESARLRDGT